MLIMSFGKSRSKALQDNFNIYKTSMLHIELPHFVQTVKKSHYGELSKKLVPSNNRCQFSLKLNTLVVVKPDVVINQILSLSESVNLLTVNAFSFENREKIFS